MSSSSIVVVADWNGEQATFDFNSSQSKQLEQPSSSDAAPAVHPLSALYRALQDTFSNLPPPFTAEGPSYRLTYLDSEGDEVELESESDLADAVAQAQAAKNKVLSLFVRPPTHVSLGRGLLGEWEQLSSSKASISPALEAAKSSAPAPAALELEKPAEQQPAVKVEPQVAPVEAAPEVKADASAAAPAVSGGVLGWLFGGSKPAASPVAAPAAPVPAVAALPEVAAAPTAVPASPAASVSSASVASPAVVAPLTESELVKQASQQAWASVSQEMGQLRDLEAQNSQSSSSTSSLLNSNSNSFVAAMDRCNEPDVLAQVLKAMIRRAEEQVGFYISAQSGSQWISKPAQLVDTMKDMEVEAFASVIEQFAEIVSAHVRAREARLAAEEAARVAALVAEMERQEAARREAEEAARREAERQEQLRQAQAAAAAAAAAEAARQAAAAEAARKEEALRQQRELEEIERRRAAILHAQAAAAAAAAASAAAQPRLPSEPCFAPAPALLQPVMAPVQPASPVLIPSVAVPVASPLGAEALSASQRINTLLTELRAMGFTNDQLNTQLLQQNNFDLNSTLDWLQTDAATGGELSAALRRAL